VEVKISQLFLYPVKSCRGIPVNKAKVTLYSFEFDRLWMLVDDKNAFVTQREIPKLVLIKQELIQNGDEYKDGGKLRLSFVNAPGSVEIPFRTSFEGLSNFKSSVHGNEVYCIDEGDEAAKVLSEYLQCPVRLAIKDPRIRRPLPVQRIPDEEAFRHLPQTAFSDSFPFLFLSEATIDDVNSHLAPKGEKVSVRNFRPNVLFSGLTPYGEDELKVVKINGHTMYCCVRCTRCQIPTNDIDTGELSHVEVSKTLMSYRRVDPGAQYAACIGMHAAHADYPFFMSVGDVMEVVETTTQHDKRGKDVNPDFWASVSPKKSMKPSWARIGVSIAVIGIFTALLINLVRNR